MGLGPALWMPCPVALESCLARGASDPPTGRLLLLQARVRGSARGEAGVHIVER